MAKNILVFSDGTGQEGGKGNSSNVYKVFNRVLDRSHRQIAFYDRGLGTDWRKLTGRIGGRGISKNIVECYEFIFSNYEAGDRIYLFGFSRGAATVRSLSGFIHLFGILPKSRSELIKKAYKIYEIRNKEKRTKKAVAFVAKHHTMWVKIRFLGVWDTVAALGLPFKKLDYILNMIPFLKHQFHDLSLSESVENAYHALSIDDIRKTFHPTLWDKKIANNQSMTQVWFPGVHSDIGGGYKESGLSDIALEWMVRKAGTHELILHGDDKVEAGPNPDGTMHDSLGFFRKKERSWNVRTHGKPIIHQSAIERTLNENNAQTPGYHPWILRLEHEIEP